MLTEERTTVGLDVHARSVVAEAVDWSTGQLFSRRLVADHVEVLLAVAYALVAAVLLRVFEREGRRSASLDVL